MRGTVDIGEVIVATLYNAMQYPAFVDSPHAPWRDRQTAACIERRCDEHESCAHREAWCTFEAWFDRVWEIR